MIKVVNKVSLLILTFLFALTSLAQTAKSVLNKTVASLSKGAATLTFSMGSSNGTITIQNNKFVLISSQASIWFDGKTEWTMMKGNNEVYVTTPTAKEIAGLNPLNFLNLHKKDCTSVLTTKSNNYEVHLVTHDAKSSIKEAYVVINKKDYLPSFIKLKIGDSNWTTISIKNIRLESKKKDEAFRFNSKDYPKVEVIDMR